MKTTLLSLTAIFAITTAIAQNGQELSADFAAVNTTGNIVTPATLPVELVSFSAALTISDAAMLKWSTPSEKNVSHFEIERSADGQNFEKAGLVFAYGNTTETSNYTFTDKRADLKKTGTIHYRVLSVINDGRAVVSMTRTIHTGKEEKELNIVTFPNPASHDLYIETPVNWQGKVVNYELFDNKGQLAKNNTISKTGHTTAIDIASLTPGYYILKATCNGEAAEQKIIKK